MAKWKLILTPAGRQLLKEYSKPTSFWMTPKARDYHTGGFKTDLSFQIQTVVVSPWPTPRTPTGGPESQQRKKELGRSKSGGGDLASVAILCSKDKKRLNPLFAGWLMGYPIAWGHQR